MVITHILNEVVKEQTILVQQQKYKAKELQKYICLTYLNVAEHTGPLLGCH